MDNNVKIVLGNGDVLDAVGISFIHVDASNKDYVFYSLNELANGNMDKIYIAEASQNGTTPGPITDDEWANIKQIMLNISHNEAVQGISYKPLIGLTINVGDAKKLAIKGDKKQAFIDAQNKAIAPTTAVDEPAFVSDQAANGSPFFAADVNAGGQTETKPIVEEQVQSAFAMQPPVQQDIPVESLDIETQQSDIIQNPVIPQVEEIDTSAAPAVEAAPVQEVAAVPEPAPVVEPQPEEPAVPEAAAVVTPVAPAESTNSTISIEELKQAVIDAQNAINKINSYLNSLNNTNTVKTVTVDTVQTQVISTGTAPVSTENMIVADQPELKTDTLIEETQLSNPTEVITTAAPAQEIIQAVVPTAEVVQPVAPVAPAVEAAPVAPTPVAATPTESVLIDTSAPAGGEILNTSVQTNVEESVVPIAIEPLENTEELGEPAFAIGDGIEQPQTIVLDNAAVPQATPNSAQDINNSTVTVAIPDAPVIDNAAPTIPIAPMEQSGIPVAEAIPTVAPIAPAAPAAPAPVAPEVAPQNVQSVPEIDVAPVQQVPTVDLSAINTDVTLPTDMASNPNPGTISEGVLGPATLDANEQAA